MIKNLSFLEFTLRYFKFSKILYKNISGSPQTLQIWNLLPKNLLSKSDEVVENQLERENSFQECVGILNRDNFKMWGDFKPL